MPVVTYPLTLTEKVLLTHDVYELHFCTVDSLPCKPGQYLLCTLPSGLKRSYSIADTDGTHFTLIIKRLEDGAGGSKEICDLEVGEAIQTMTPIGHFVLTD